MARLCGWALARAHAKGGDETTISGYLGMEDNFDSAMGKFAIAYADQAERDHAALKTAVRTGKIDVILEVVNAGCRRIADRSDKRAAWTASGWRSAGGTSDRPLD